MTFEAWELTCAASEQPPCALLEPLRSAEERTSCAPPEVAPVALTYLVERLAVTTAEGEPAGVDVDGLDSGDGSDILQLDCEDFTPDAPRSDRRGVDNALPTLVPVIEAIYGEARCPGGDVVGCADALLTQQTASGGRQLLVRVSGVDDLRFDPEVEVQLRFVDAPGAPERSLGAPAAGAIFDGELRVRLGELSLPVDGLLAPPRLERVALRGSIGEVLLDVELGGVGSLEEAVTAATRAAARFDPSLEERPVRAILELTADVSPQPAMPEDCSAISVGYALRAIRVR